MDDIILKDILETAILQKASDLHFSVDHPPVLRVSGKLIPLIRMKILEPQDTQNLAFELMTEEHKFRFLREKEIDFSYSFKGSRFRVNIFYQRNSIACALRLIPEKIRTIEELNLPPILHEFIRKPQGFILVTGPSGQGKSTTLAAMIDEINHIRSEHIVTIEDPIEYVFLDDRCIINQREIGQDSLSFGRALKSVFREDPNVIMIGEMRDSETIATAITAAETGHLVLATLHTNSAGQTIHRIVDSFTAEQQNQIRAQLSGSLIGIISQRLVPKIKGGLIPACEILINTPAVANLIRENKIHEVPLVIETSAEIGMISLNRYLANLVRAKEIDLETAQSFSLDPYEVKALVKR